jgi:hypothetical protein
MPIRHQPLRPNYVNCPSGRFQSAAVAPVAALPKPRTAAVGHYGKLSIMADLRLMSFGFQKTLASDKEGYR